MTQRTRVDSWGRPRCVDCNACVDGRWAHDCPYVRLRAAMPTGLILSEREDKWLHWLASFDRDAVEPVLSLLARLQVAAGCASVTRGAKPALHCDEHRDTELDWEDCGQCDGYGFFYPADEGSVEYAKDECERCPGCGGKGGWRVCCDCEAEALRGSGSGSGS